MFFKILNKNMVYNILFLICMCWFLNSCETEDELLVKDCAGISGGNSICGCTDSTAFNYNNDATHDDGSCEAHIDNGDYYLSFNGANSHVDLYFSIQVINKFIIVLKIFLI